MASLAAQKAGGIAQGEKQNKERAARIRAYNANPNICFYCARPILAPAEKPPRQTKIRKFCNRSCAAKFNNSRRPRKPKPEKRPRLPSLLGDKTKGELFERAGTWQSARSQIRRHATTTYEGTSCCAVCAYPIYTEICHIRAVSEFPSTATLSEINSPMNLVRLCPNHHWELDHQVLGEKNPYSESNRGYELRTL